MPGPALLRDTEPSIAPVLALFRVVPAPLSGAGVLGGHIPAILRDSEPSNAPVLALFRVLPAPLSSAGVLGGHIPALLGAPHFNIIHMSTSNMDQHAPL